MKKLFFIVFTALMMTSCGVGSYTISSGKADEGALSFTSNKTADIIVTVDDAVYKIKSVKEVAFKKDRKIKKTARNTIKVAPGTHEVKVVCGEEIIFSKKVFISASEHKVVEL